VLVVGAGGLGSPLALYLAAAGVGTIGIVDFDASRSRTSSARSRMAPPAWEVEVGSITARLHDLNPYVRVIPHECYLDRSNALAIVREYDVIVDGTDNFATRYLVNDACVLEGKPNVYGSILRFEGQASVFDARVGPCYRCLFPEPPPAGVSRTAPRPACWGAPRRHRLDPGHRDDQAADRRRRHARGPAAALRRARDAVSRDAAAEGSALSHLRRAAEHRELQDYDALCGVKPHESAADQIGARELADRLARGEDMVLVDVREPHELAIAKFPNAVHVPLRTVPTRASELPRERLLVLTCHKGVRSQRALEILRELGFTRLKNLAGGIDSWSREVDSSVPRY
jgi:adenylyltransferase/sulfurtransferase